mmetsp:Transcript_14594/g.61553  ORF Transcript_14594/g.61553 Transcript_14594/m.61553 type:complete len:374 (-) Transcript_14594:1063-2184(-)
MLSSGLSSWSPPNVYARPSAPRENRARAVSPSGWSSVKPHATTSQAHSFFKCASTCFRTPRHAHRGRFGHKKGRYSHKRKCCSACLKRTECEHPFSRRPQATSRKAHSEDACRSKSPARTRAAHASPGFATPGRPHTRTAREQSNSVESRSHRRPESGQPKPGWSMRQRISFGMTFFVFGSFCFPAAPSRSSSRLSSSPLSSSRTRSHTSACLHSTRLSATRETTFSSTGRASARFPRLCSPAAPSASRQSRHQRLDASAVLSVSRRSAAFAGKRTGSHATSPHARHSTSALGYAANATGAPKPSVYVRLRKHSVALARVAFWSFSETGKACVATGAASRHRPGAPPFQVSRGCLFLAGTKPVRRIDSAFFRA